MKKYIMPAICIIAVIYCIIMINIDNTEALSPIGNTEDNFQLVSKEFGEDFSEFIKDKSPVKIYVGEEGDDAAKVKIFSYEIRLTKDNVFLKGVKPVFNFIEDKISDFTNKSTEKSNTNSNETGQDLDNILNNFNNSNNNGQ